MKGIFVTVLLVVAVIGGFFYAYSVFSTPPQGSDEQAINSSGNVVYYKNVQGYLALPAESAQTRPAVILIHEWWGLNDDIKSLARRFANEGYVALAVDLYDGEVATSSDNARALAGAVRGNTDEAFANLNGAVAYLRSRADVTKDQLASVGWCFGGGWSYQMATNDLGTKASVMYYGQFDPEDDFAHMKASILGHFGETDTGIKVDSVKEFQAKLQTTNGPHEVYIYPNAGHGFANDREGTNAAYNKEAADIAWERTLLFLTNAFKSE